MGRLVLQLIWYRLQTPYNTEPSGSESAGIGSQVDHKSSNVPRTIVNQVQGIGDPRYSVYSLPQTCAHILSDTILAEALVITFRCFSQVAMGVVHRFVVLKLSHDQTTHKWLRFDRRPDRSIPLAKIVASGAPANDSVSFLSLLLWKLIYYNMLLDCIWHHNR